MYTDYPQFLDPNKYAGMYNPAHNPASAPSGFSQFLWNMGQYGVSALSPLAGTTLSLVGNIGAQWYQNHKQEEFYNEYMSPQARMAQMKAAGINPNAAAQGISGALPPQMSAAAPTSAFTGVGDQLGNSVNTALTARAIRAGIAQTDAETDLTNSLNAEKTITNKYLNATQLATLNKLVADGEISRSFANMAAVDEAFKPATAYASFQQLVSNLNKTASEIEHLKNSALHELAGVYQSMAAASLSEAEIHKVFSDIGLNNAMINRISHEVSEIDARTASTYQDIDESKARQAAQEIQNKFQQDYYDIWQNTGFNWNSDIEKSIVGAYQNFDIDAGDRMAHSLQRYLVAVDESQAMSDKYMLDFTQGLIHSLVGVIGLGGVATIHANASNRVPSSRTTTTFESNGVRYQTTRYGDVVPFSGHVSKRSRPVVKP